MRYEHSHIERRDLSHLSHLSYLNTVALLCVTLLSACDAEESSQPTDARSVSDEIMMTQEDMGMSDQDITSPEPDEPSEELDPAEPPRLLVGKGAERFISMQDGEVSTLHRGCQGAQHLWVSLRLPRDEPDEYAVELQLVDEDDALLAPPFTLTEEAWLAYQDETNGEEITGSEIIGLTLVIFDPMAVVGGQALVKAKVSVDGETLESHVWVEVQWGADAC